MVQRKQEEYISEELLAQLVPEGMIEQQTGFPPYWTPEIGAKFNAVVIEKDIRVDDDQEEVSSGSFTRYKFSTNEDLLCHQGPADKSENVMVSAGDEFTCSAYGSLNLDIYIGLPVTVIVVGTRKLPPNKASRGAPRDMWIFKVLCDAKTDRIVKDIKRRMAEAQRTFILEQRLKGLGTLALPNGKKTTVAEGNLEEATS